MYDCSVCFAPTSNTISPCAHPVCEECIDKWILVHERTTCPLCRGTVVSTRTTPPNVLTTVSVRIGILERLRRLSHTDSSIYIKITLPANQHAGVTYKNASTTKGVRILKLKKKDRAHHCGLMVGDVITHMNNIPVHNHEHARDMTNRATDAKVDLVCTVVRYRLAKPPKWLQCFGG